MWDDIISCLTQLVTFVSTHKNQLKYDLTILLLKSLVENLIVSVVPDILIEHNLFFFMKK